MRCWQCKKKATKVHRIKTANGEQNVCKDCKEIYFPDVEVLEMFTTPNKTEAERPERKIPVCPKCGKLLHKKLNRNTRQEFMGCSGYPDCRFTRNIWRRR